MAKPGRKPKPHGLKVLEGKFPAKGGGARSIGGDPGGPPAYLPAEAKTLWEYYRGKLMRYRIVGELDGVALENLCLATTMRRKAARALFRDGVVRVDKKQGHRKAKSPWWQIYRDAQAAERQWAEQLGLTPAARERLKINPPGEVDDMEKLLGEGKS
jgi:P27 family predicted phage terminase small subunit